MKRKAKKLAVSRETLMDLNKEQLAKPDGGTVWPTFNCPTSNGPYFCDHNCA